MLERITEFVQAFLMGFYEAAPVYVTVETKDYYNNQFCWRRKKIFQKPDFCPVFLFSEYNIIEIAPLRQIQGGRLINKVLTERNYE